MHRMLGAGLLAAGIVLIIFGINASESFASDVSRFFNGSPTDKTIWMLVGGAASLLLGLFLVLRGARNS